MPTIRDLWESKDVALRLPLRFDATRLAQDLAGMEEAWWQNHLSDYHDGNWQSISLYAPGGERTSQVSYGSAFAPTEAMSGCAYVQEVLDRIPGVKNRVRFLRLRPGGRIFPHSDPMHQIDPRMVRVHVPVRTNPQVAFTVNGKGLQMSPGETWFVDVRFRHAVTNAGADDRVHLVVDVLANDELRALMREGESMGRANLAPYFLKHALPHRLVRLLGIGN